MAAIACPTRAELLAWSSGSLERDRLQAIAEHVEHCLTCLATVEALDPAGPSASDASLDGPQQHRMPGPDHRETGPEPGDRTSPHASGPGSAPTLPLQLGAYQILEELGRGGMGAVYKARHTRLKRVVALKTVASDRVHDPQALARFEREMVAVGKLDHPNIVRASDAGEAGGVHYLVMEYVEGQDLARLVKHRGPLPIADACEIIRQAAEGLEHAHRRGLVHRDIKPQNLMLTPEGRVKVLDLGLARLWGEHPAGEGLTASGQIMGTPDYMAPEQASDVQRVDIRADIYSLGCTLYYLLAGRPPYHGPSYSSAWSKLMAHAQQPVPPIRERRPEVPEALAAVLDRMLAKDPAGRFQTPAEVAAALTPLAAGSRLSALLEAEAEATVDLRSGSGPDAESSEPPPVPPPSTTQMPAEPPMTATTQDRPPATEPWGLKLDEPAPLHAAGTPPRRKVPAWVVVAAVMGFGGLLLLWQVVVRIRDKEGGETKIEVPKDSTITIEEGGKVVATVPSTAPEPPQAEAPGTRPMPAPVAIRPEPLPPLKAGEPLSPIALVVQPAEIQGLRGWTIETRGHRGTVRAIAYSPDGSLLATAGDDSTIRLLDAATGQLVRTLVGHGAAINGLAYSPDGKTLASASADMMVRFWDASSGQSLRTIQGHNDAVLAVAWSPDGKTLASGSQDTTVRLWEATSRQLLRILQAETHGIIYSMAWSPDGKILAPSSADQMVHLWDPDSGQHLRTLEGHKSGVYAVAWSPDGKAVASGGGLGEVRLWEAESGKPLRTLEGLEGNVIAVLWSPDGKTLACGSHVAASVRLYEVESGKQVRIFEVAPSFTATVAWSPDGKILAAGCGDGTVRNWDAESGQLRLTHSGHASAFDVAFSGFRSKLPLAWSPDGKVLAVGTMNGTVLLRDAGSGQSLRTLQGLSASVVGFLAWSPDGQTLAAGCQEGESGLWEAGSGRLLHRFDAGTVLDLAWSPDGKTVASGSYDGKMRLWRAESGELLHILTVDENHVYAVAWSPDGKTVATGGNDGTTRLWEASPGRSLRTLQGQYAGQVTSVAWSPDGKTLASGSNEGKVRLWDVESGQLLEDLDQGDYVYKVSWSWDSKVLICWINRGIVKTWDAASGQLQRTIRRPAAGVVTADGRLVASPGPNTVHCWEAETVRPRGTLVLLNNDQWLTISPDGHYRGSPRVERNLIYVVQTDAGQETLSPQEFATKYGWTNDPERVHLTGP